MAESVRSDDDTSSSDEELTLSLSAGSASTTCESSPSTRMVSLAVAERLVSFSAIGYRTQGIGEVREKKVECEVESEEERGEVGSVGEDGGRRRKKEKRNSSLRSKREGGKGTVRVAKEFSTKFVSIVFRHQFLRPPF